MKIRGAVFTLAVALVVLRLWVILFLALALIAWALASALIGRRLWY